MIRLIRILVCFLLTSQCLMSSCYSTSPRNKVVLQLRWSHQFQFAGYYAAQWKGYYNQEGIDVEIHSAFDGSAVKNSTEEVSKGNAQFGIGAADILIAEDSGQHFSLVASIFQRSAVEYYALDSTSLNSIYELSQLHIARRENDLLDVELQALFQSEGIHPFSNNFTNILNDFTVDDLITGRYDVVPGYLGKISYVAEQKGIPLKVLQPINYGIDFYGDTLFTSKALATENPELVERFRRASLKGWAYALEHPDEIADKIAQMTYDEDPSGPSLDERIAFNRYQAQKVLELTHTPIVEIGNMNPYRWTKMAKTLKSLDIIQEEPAMDHMIFNYNTINIQRLKQTAQNATIVFLTVLGIMALFFIVALKKRNTLLKNEIKVRKDAEHRLSLSTIRYETIFQSSVLGITMTDSEGNILHVNDAWSTMTGFDSATLVTMNIQDLIAPESAQVDNEEMKQLQSGAILSYSVEKKYLRNPSAPGAEFFYGKLFMTRIYDPKTDGRVNMAMVMDITREVLEQEAEKRSEERFMKIIHELTSEMSDVVLPQEALHASESLPLRLEAINIELERLFKRELEENRRKEALIIYQGRMAAMGEMIGNIAHQWRQPLNTLRLILANLKEETQDPDPVYRLSAFEKANTLIDKMSETIDDFRYFSNPHSEPRPFELSAPLKASLDLLEEQFRTLDIHVEYQYEIINLFGPENQLTHSFFNLLTNAMEALKTLPSSQKKIISIQVLKRDNDGIILFGDNGPGISKDIQSQIFKQHYTTKRHAGGSGLGLYMTRSIIENSFSGHIALLDTTPGAHFEIQIPLKTS